MLKTYTTTVDTSGYKRNQSKRFKNNLLKQIAHLDVCSRRSDSRKNYLVQVSDDSSDGMQGIDGRNMQCNCIIHPAKSSIIKIVHKIYLADKALWAWNSLRIRKLIAEIIHK
jgi:hypothetical protein